VIAERFLPPERSIALERNLERASRGEPVSEAAVARELELFRAAFGQEDLFANALQSAGLSADELRVQIADHLRARGWVERQIAPQLAPSESEMRDFYRDHRERFRQPQRFRVSHIFLAAPVGSAPDVVAEKRSAIQGLAIRLLAGENFVHLAAEGSEDEASKTRGGDLGYFSSARMPEEFIAEGEKLHRGETSAPIQSHLGFHIFQLTDTKPPRDMTFEEAKGEIALALANEKRAAAVAALQEQLKLADVAVQGR
jgi:foldase protein PrsA